MSTLAESILAHLEIVERERGLRLADPALAAKVVALKSYQQRRFPHTYGDLLRTTRYGPASRFFLEELYGPNDFARRDAQFARVVPALVRLFPAEIVETVATLAELHALSEVLDTSMGGQVDGIQIDGMDYIRAWQRVGRAADREKQIGLTLEVAGRLDRFTRRVFLRNSLRMMRGPARAAGLAELQGFLEAGFDTFREMKGAEEFVATVSGRERSLASSLFAADVEREDAASTLQAQSLLPPRGALAPR